MTQAHMYSNWRAPVCSMEVSTVVVSACVAAVACAGAYVLWGPDQLWKRPGTACVYKHEVARIQGS